MKKLHKGNRRSIHKHNIIAAQDLAVRYAKMDTESPSPRPALHVLRSPTVELTVERAMLTSRCKMHAMLANDNEHWNHKNVSDAFNKQLLVGHHRHRSDTWSSSTTLDES